MLVFATLKTVCSLSNVELVYSAMVLKFSFSIHNDNVGFM